MSSVHSLFDLSGKTAVVSGGSRGLGLEMAIGLGEAGASIAILGRRAEWLASARDELRRHGIDGLPLVCDVTDGEAIVGAVRRVVDRFDSIDVLINSAGIAWAEPSITMSADSFRRVLETNITGCFLMSQAVARHMIEAGRGGSIVNIASIAGLIGTPATVLDAAGYSASKGAIVSLTKDLAVKWARYQIRVNAIAPGFFATRLTTAVLERNREEVERAAPMGRIGRSGELKGVAVFFASAASAYVTGQVLPVDGGTTAW